MKIISKFKDYYDIGLSMGIDESIIYVRKTEDVKLHDFDEGYILDVVKYPRKNQWSFTYNRLSTIRFAVGFCGKIYPGVMIPNHSAAYSNKPFEQFNFHFKWSKSLSDDIDKHNSHCSPYERISQENKNHIKKFVSLEPVVSDDLFHQLKTPIFVIPNRTLISMWGFNNEQGYHNIDKYIVHPNLSNVQFQKVIDPFMSYQEIMTYISGVLSTNKIPPVEISDIHMRDAKGFDDKSFKKHPTKNYRK